MDSSNHLLIGPLKTRPTPRQQRAQDRVKQILHAAADILIYTPPHAASTTMIAEKAGIPVSSVYRYFPKLEDVFDELYLQTSEDFERRVFAIFEDIKTYPGWRDRHRGVHTEFRSFRLEHPYYLPLLQSFISRTGPETVDIGKPMGIVAYLAQRWSTGWDGFRGGDPKIVAQITMQTFLGVEGYLAAQVDAVERDRYFEELSLNLESYLANYLSDDR